MENRVVFQITILILRGGVMDIGYFSWPGYQVILCQAKNPKVSSTAKFNRPPSQLNFSAHENFNTRKFLQPTNVNLTVIP
jgi:hypothetical protein